MATLRAYKAFELTNAGRDIKAGSKSAPTEITVTGKVKEYIGSIPATSSITFWEASNTSEALSDFDCLIIEATDTVIVELTVDANNSTGIKTFAQKIPAGATYDLIAGNGYANFTTDVATGSLDAIEKIRLRNPSATSSATVRSVLIT